MFAALDLARLADRGTKQLEFVATERLTLRCRRADGAMVFGEDQIGAVLGHLGHVTLTGALVREHCDPTAHVVGIEVRHSILEFGEVGTIAGSEYDIDRVGPEFGPHRLQQFDREVAVAVGEEFDGQLGERPTDRRSAPRAGDQRLRVDQPACFEFDELGAHRLGRHAERFGDCGGRARPTPLQVVDDTPLGVADPGRLVHGDQSSGYFAMKTLTIVPDPAKVHYHKLLLVNLGVAMNLEHANVTVRNPEESAAMLCRIFGWHIRWEGPSLMGGRTVHVGSDSSYLALYTPGDDPGERTHPDRVGGLQHLGILVDDLDLVEARVRAEGIEPHTFMTYDPGRRFYFDDHDGIEFEVVAYDT